MSESVVIRFLGVVSDDQTRVVDDNVAGDVTDNVLHRAASVTTKQAEDDQDKKI